MPKKNLHKIPQKIQNKIFSSKSRYFVAGCLKTYARNDIIKGELKHLTIEFVNNEIKIPAEIIPTALRGKFSNRNIHGYEVKRKDLPMEPYSIIFEAPNWGDSYNGTHEVVWPKERYPIDFRAPRLAFIKMECLDLSPNLDSYTFKFEVSEILDKEADDFEDRLLESLNILQENIYTCDIVPAGSTFSDYIQDMRVSWEILPPGTKEEVIQRIFRNSKPSKEQIEVVGDRWDFFNNLKLEKIIYGASGFQRYFGALLQNNLVIFENIRYGNAIYLMYDNWQELSTKSRLELLSGRYGNNFDRVIHKTGWKKEVKLFIDNFRNTKSR